MILVLRIADSIRKNRATIRARWGFKIVGFMIPVFRVVVSRILEVRILEVITLTTYVYRRL